MNKLTYFSILIFFLIASTYSLKGESKETGQNGFSRTYQNFGKDYLDFIGYSNQQPVFRNRKDNQVVKLGVNNELIKVIDSNFHDYEPFYYCDYGYCKVLKADRKQIIVHVNNLDYNFMLPSVYTTLSFSSKMDTMYYDDVKDGIIKYYVIKTKKRLSTHIKGYGPTLNNGVLYFTRSTKPSGAGDVEVTLFKSDVITSKESMVIADIFEDGWRISPNGDILLYCLGDGYHLFKLGTNLKRELDIKLDTNLNVVYYDYSENHFVFMNGSDFSKRIIK